MRPGIAILSSLLLLPACVELQSMSTLAIEQRRVMNDMQARATMAATCDIALGAYFRELNDHERNYVALVCGGINPRQEPLRPGGALDEERPRLMTLPGLSS